MAGKPFPRAVYRLQLNREFTFDDAHRIVPYLHALGISHLYVSPCLKARAGSLHGYDIVDHASLNPELGGSEAFARLVDNLRVHGMGLILDIVPNHMGIGSGENEWWLDVLENGQASAYATYFDIDWHPIRESLRGKVLLAILGDHYGKVLEAGELRLAFDEQRGEFGVYYCDRRLPLDPETYPVILTHETEKFTALANAENHALLEWHSVVTDFEQLRQLRADHVERARSAAACKRRLAAFCALSPCARAFVDEMIILFNGVAGKPESFDQLHELLELQSFRLAYWRVAADEINYRRFFDINDLVCLRQQIPEVFEASHRLILALIAEGNVDGLRIDHVDGLWHPRAYCERLQNEFSRIATQEPNRADTTVSQPFYLLVEKILAGYEHLRDDWPIAGTTGYDFANSVNGLFVHAPSEHRLTKAYHRFIGERLEFDDVLYDRKRQVIKTQMSNQLTTLVNLLAEIAEAERTTRDYSLNGLREAILEVVAYFPVYRTYIVADDIQDEDRRFVEWAIAHAKKRSPAADLTIFDFIHDVLLLRNLEDCSTEYCGLVLQFVMRFQQYTAPVMAKGMEDTSFYVYNRLVSLNDVGGDPRRFGTSVAAFHHANQQRLKQWPLSLITLSTHDSKRSADVRARINVLSELAIEWRQRQYRWRRLNRAKKHHIDTLLAPSHNAEYLLYQTLLGTWPQEELDAETLASFAGRIESYMLKAIREAKIHTSWINPNQIYEQAVSSFVQALLNPKKSRAFHDDFLHFQNRVALFGLYNSLSQTVLHLTSPGIPDIYQGTELWHFTLVDPDNRRPVDFALRERYLHELQRAEHESGSQRLLQDMLAHLEDGRAKLFVIWKTLAYRNAHPELFSRGDYVPLEAIGEKAEHICAYLWQRGDDTLIVIVGRWFALLETDQNTSAFLWQDTRIAIPETLKDISFQNVFSKTSARVQDVDGGLYLIAEEVFQHFPVALLASNVEIAP